MLSVWRLGPVVLGSGMRDGGLGLGFGCRVSGLGFRAWVPCCCVIMLSVLVDLPSAM